MVYLQTDCLKTDVKYGTNRKEDVMFNGNMRVSQPHASKYYIKMSRSRKKFPAGVNCCCKSQRKESGIQAVQTKSESTDAPGKL